MNTKTDGADDLLESALLHVYSGEPLPLHWAVVHVADFPAAWVSSIDPGLLLELAAFIVPRSDLVRAACALVQTVLASGFDERSANAIDVAKQWARIPTMSTGDVREACNDAADAITELRGLAQGVAQAACDAAFLAIGDVDDVSEAARSCASKVFDVAYHDAKFLRTRGIVGVTGRDALLRWMADLVRAQLANRDILADLVNANRGVT